MNVTNSNSYFGSFIPLEICLNKSGNHYHEKAVQLNTARNAFQLALSKRNAKKVYLPYYSCDALYIPLERLSIKIEFYSIDSNFTPIFNYSKIGKDEYFLYINYFGLNNDVVLSVINNGRNVIIDNSQAFFSDAKENTPTFYSARKFFGVADGAYLYDTIDISLLKKDVSYKRYQYLLMNLDVGQELAYKQYVIEENKLDLLLPKRISKMTSNILSRVVYEKYSTIRLRNYRYLDSKLSRINKIKKFNIETAPLCYPLLLDNGELIRKELIERKVYLPTYWSNVLLNVDVHSIEYDFVNNILPIHIDHRYTIKELDIVIEVINSFL